VNKNKTVMMLLYVCVMIRF